MGRSTHIFYLLWLHTERWAARNKENIVARNWHCVRVGTGTGLERGCGLGFEQLTDDATRIIVFILIVEVSLQYNKTFFYLFCV